MKKGINTIDQIAEAIGMPIDVLKEELVDYFSKQGKTLEILTINDIADDYLYVYRFSRYLKLLTISEIERISRELDNYEYGFSETQDGIAIIRELIDRCKKGGIE